MEAALFEQQLVAFNPSLEILIPLPCETARYIVVLSILLLRFCSSPSGMRCRSSWLSILLLRFDTLDSMLRVVEEGVLSILLLRFHVYICADKVYGEAGCFQSFS